MMSFRANIWQERETVEEDLSKLAIWQEKNQAGTLGLKSSEMVLKEEETWKEDSERDLQ